MVPYRGWKRSRSEGTCSSSARGSLPDSSDTSPVPCTSPGAPSWQHHGTEQQPRECNNCTHVGKFGWSLHPSKCKGNSVAVVHQLGCVRLRRCKQLRKFPTSGLRGGLEIPWAGKTRREYPRPLISFSVVESDRHDSWRIFGYAFSWADIFFFSFFARGYTQCSARGKAESSFMHHSQFNVPASHKPMFITCHRGVGLPGGDANSGTKVQSTHRQRRSKHLVCCTLAHVARLRSFRHDFRLHWSDRGKFVEQFLPRVEMAGIFNVMSKDNRA